jgi:hypothetical protein
MKKAFSLIIFSFILVLSACGESVSNDPLTPVLDAEQFSLVNQAFVKDKLGEPESFEDMNYKTPSTGTNNLLTYYYYDWQGYYSEFVFDDKDRLIRINIYASDNEESEFVKSSFEDHLKQLNVTPGENLSKVVDNNLTWRYQRVSDKVDEVWTISDGENIDVIKVSFDVRPFM